MRMELVLSDVRALPILRYGREIWRIYCGNHASLSMPTHDRYPARNTVSMHSRKRIVLHPQAQ